MKKSNFTTLGTIKPLVKMLLAAKVTPYLHDSPGLGKSALAQQIAHELNLFLIDKRLTDMEPTDIPGLPTFVNGRSEFVPFREFPIATDEVPEGYKGWLIMLDEFESGPQSVQAA